MVHVSRSLMIACGVLLLAGIGGIVFMTAQPSGPIDAAPQITSVIQPTSAPIIPAPPLEMARVRVGKITIEAQVARSPQQRAQGLSGREELLPGTGMLFIEPQPTRPGFWMKDMNFSLDIVWIGEKHTIVDISAYVHPESYPRIFYPDADVTYVLEVPAGWADENRVSVGDAVRIEFVAP